jgi:hypothetical protein
VSGEPAAAAKASGPLRPTVSAVEVRQLTLEDLDWAVAVLARRRAALVPYAPVYWRPASGAADLHRTHLRHVIAEAGGLGFRTDDALLVAVPGRRGWTIDDAAVPDGGWDSVGRRLWAAFASQVEGDAVRFVCPVPETDRLHFAVRLGLEVVESWWHLEIPLTAGRAAARDPKVSGATAVRVQAPPVYDPGGEIQFLRQVSDPARALASAQHNAAAQGNPLVVVSQMVGDAALVEALEASGFRRHCDFVQGRLAVP